MLSVEVGRQGGTRNGAAGVKALKKKGRHAQRKAAREITAAAMPTASLPVRGPVPPSAPYRSMSSNAASRACSQSSVYSVMLPPNRVWRARPDVADDSA